MRFIQALVAALLSIFVVLSIAQAQGIPTTDFANVPASPTTGQLHKINDGSGTPILGEPAAGGGTNLDLISWDAVDARWEFVQRIPVSGATPDQTKVVNANRVFYDDTITQCGADDVQEALDTMTCLGGVQGGGAPGVAEYLTGSADPTLTNEIVIDTLSALNTHLGSNIESDAAGDQSAAEVPYSNSTSRLIATDAQAAVDELSKTRSIATTPGQVGDRGNQDTIEYYYGLQRFGCAPTFATTFYFDPIAGNDANDGLSLATAKQTMCEMDSVCTADNVECVGRDGGAWTPKRATLSGRSGTFELGEIVSNGNGMHAKIVDYLAGFPDVLMLEDQIDHAVICTDADGGNWFWQMNGNLNFALAWNISAAALETAVEGLHGIYDVNVSGTGVCGSDPWIVDAVDPPYFPTPPTIGDFDLTNGTLTVSSLRVAASDTLTGATSGATATLASVLDVADCELVYDDVDCTPGTMCNLFRSQGPNQIYISGAWTSIGSGSGGPVFEFSDDTVYGMSGVTITKHIGDVFRGTTSTEFIAINSHFPLAIWENVNQQGSIIDNNTRSIFINTDGSQITYSDAGIFGDFIVGDAIMIGRGTYAKARGNPVTFDADDGNGSPIILPADMLFIGHTFDGSEIADDTSNPDHDGIVELHPNDPPAGDQLRMYDVTFRGQEGSQAAVFDFFQASHEQPYPIKMRNVTVSKLKFLLTMPSYTVVHAGEIDTAFDIQGLLLHDLTSGGAIINAPTVYAIRQTSMSIVDSQVDDSAQTSDWIADVNTYNDVTTFLGDAEVSAGSWAIDFQEKFNTAPGEELITLPFPIPAEVNHSCRPIKELLWQNRDSRVGANG